MRDSIKALFQFAWAASSIPQKIIAGGLLALSIFNLALNQYSDGALLLVIFWFNILCFAYAELTSRQAAVLESMKEVIEGRDTVSWQPDHSVTVNIGGRDPEQLKTELLKMAADQKAKLDSIRYMGR